MVSDRINKQHPEPVILDSYDQEPDSLQVIEVFKTIQGEGPFAGVPAIFIRLAGCNIQCPMCDTQYTEGRTSIKHEALIEMVLNMRTIESLLVITGGEPLRQNERLFRFLTKFRKVIEEKRRDGPFFKDVQVETNGTLYIMGLTKFCHLVISPKGPLHLNYHGHSLDVVYKYVLTAGEVDLNDGLPTSVLGRRRPPARPPIGIHPSCIYLQPADLKDEALNRANLDAVVQSCLTYGYRMNLQLHKIAGLA